MRVKKKRRLMSIVGESTRKALWDFVSAKRQEMWTKLDSVDPLLDDYQENDINSCISDITAYCEDIICQKEKEIQELQVKLKKRTLFIFRNDCSVMCE